MGTRIAGPRASTECLGGSAWVEADRTRIEQAVSNLVSNAERLRYAGIRTYPAPMEELIRLVSDAKPAA